MFFQLVAYFMKIAFKVQKQRDFSTCIAADSRAFVCLICTLYRRKFGLLLAYFYQMVICFSKLSCEFVKVDFTHHVQRIAGAAVGYLLKKLSCMALLTYVEIQHYFSLWDKEILLSWTAQAQKGSEGYSAFGVISCSWGPLFCPPTTAHGLQAEIAQLQWEQLTGADEMEN